jgi:enoyl-CoA hydratase/carnithine racemase
MTFEHIELGEADDGVLLVRLASSADRVNTLHRAMVRELREAVGGVRNSSGLKLLVFTGKGRTFSVGADLNEIRDAGPEEIRSFLHAGQSLMRMIMDLQIPAVAAVNGLALGGGLELALACDIRWAHRRSVFGMPESKRGLIPGWGGIPLLERLVQEPFLHRMVARGEYFSARKVHEAGLVSRLFDDADFEATVSAEIKKMTCREGHELREIKDRARRDKGDADLSACDEAFLRLWNDPRRGGPALMPAYGGLAGTGKGKD